MRHRNLRGKLERPTGHRRALVRNQVTSLLAHERIETTDAKAKVLRRVADRMITLGKRGTLHARRQALAVIRDRDVAAKVFDQLAQRYAERQGGYTRVLKSRQRVGDAAPMSIVELVDAEVGAERPAKAPEKARATRAPKAPAEKPARAERPRRSARAEKAEPKQAAAKKAAAKKSAGKEGGGKGGRAGGTARRKASRSADR